MLAWAPLRALAVFTLSLVVITIAAAAAPSDPERDESLLSPYVLSVNRNNDKAWVWLINNGEGCPETPKDLTLCSGDDCAAQKQRSGWKYEGGFMPWPPFVGGRRTCKPAIFERVPFADDERLLTLRSNGRVLGEVSADAIRAKLACTPRVVDDRIEFHDCHARDATFEQAEMWLYGPGAMRGPVRCAPSGREDDVVTCALPQDWRGLVGKLGIEVKLRGNGTCNGVKRCDVNRRAVRETHDFRVPTDS